MFHPYHAPSKSGEGLENTSKTKITTNRAAAVKVSVSSPNNTANKSSTTNRAAAIKVSVSSPNNTTNKSSTTLKKAAVKISFPPPNLKEYADSLAIAIDKIQITDFSSDTDFLKFLVQLAYLYMPSLFKNKQSRLPIILQKIPDEREHIQIEPEEFIFLVHQILYLISDSVEQKDISQNKLPEETPAPPANTGVMAPQLPVSELKTKREVSTSTHQTLLKTFRTNPHRATPKIHQKHPVRIVDDPTSELKQRLREIFDRAGEPRAGNYKGNFARAYNNAAKKINQSGLPNLNNRDVLTNIFANNSSLPVYKSEKTEKFAVIFSNIITSQLYDDTEVIPLIDFKKIRLINILCKVCHNMEFGKEHKKDRSALLKKTEKYIEEVDAAFKSENESRLRALLQALMDEFNSMETTLVEPINIMAKIHNEMLVIPPGLINERIAETIINPVQATIFIQNKKSLPNNNSSYEKLLQADLKKINDDYIVFADKSEALKNEFQNVNISLDTLTQKTLSFLASKVNSLKQTIFNNNNEAENLTRSLSEKTNQLLLDEKQLSEQNIQMREFITKNNTATNEAESKRSEVNTLESKLEENVMKNYNKKYTYTKLTRDILGPNNSDNRPPEIKLANRWWDRVWFLGIERFCNWVSGTTTQERKNDALAAIKIINTFNKNDICRNDKMPLDYKWIGKKEMEWLLTDESEADHEYKTGNMNYEMYNIKVKDFNDAKKNETTIIAENTKHVTNIREEITRLNLSIRDLNINQADLRKRLNDLNGIIPQDVQTLNSIKEWLLKEAELIAEKIALLRHEETAEKLRNLHTKITDIIKEIDKPSEKFVDIIVNHPSPSPSLAVR